MVFTYFKCVRDEENAYFTEPFEYEPDEDAVRRKTAEFIYNEYFDRAGTANISAKAKQSIIDSIIEFTDENDNWDELEEFFKAGLYEEFSFEAQKALMPF